ncbi:UDP pyrophosphate phosphatase, partial [Escherichia coli]
AYLPGVDMRNCYFGKKTMKGKDEILYEQPGWNANLDGAIHLYDEVIIIYKITPKKIDTEEIATKQSTAEEIIATQLLNDPE